MSKLSRFAHLVGFAKSAEDDKKDKENEAGKPARMEGESDEDYAKRCEDDEKKKDEEARKAAAEPKDVNDDDKAQKAALAAATAQGVAAERTRWSTVLSSPEVEGKIVAACDLLSDSDMDASAISKVLGKLGAVRSSMASRHVLPTPAPAAGDHVDPKSASTPKGFAARVAAATEKARGGKKV